MRPLTLVTSLVVLLPDAAGAQVVLSDHEPGRWDEATWVDDANFLAANALIGGLTAGLASRLRGGSFADAFSRGALGGGVGYLGKRLSAARFDGAGLAGRELSAVGWSIVRNAGLGIPVLDTLVLPFGPLRAFVPTGDPMRARMRVDVNDVVWLAGSLANDRLAFDWRSSLSAGAPVFRASGRLLSASDTTAGVHASGLVVVSDIRGVDLKRVLAHERVHVAQLDFVETALAYPLEDALAGRLGLHRRRALRVLLPGVAHFGLLWPFAALDDSHDPLQVEAEFLESR